MPRLVGGEASLLVGVTLSLCLEWVLVPAVLGAKVLAACASLLGTLTLEWVLLLLWTAASVVSPPACV